MYRHTDGDTDRARTYPGGSAVDFHPDTVSDSGADEAEPDVAAPPLRDAPRRSAARTAAPPARRAPPAHPCLLSFAARKRPIDPQAATTIRRTGIATRGSDRVREREGAA